MMKTDLFLVIRKLKKDLRYTLMIILGLTFGFAGTGLIGLYIVNEISVDKRIKNSDHVFNLQYKVNTGDGVNELTGSPAPMADVVRNLPEVDAVTRFVNYQFKVEIDKNKAVFNEYQALYADEYFFKVFEFPLLSKSTDELLKAPNTAVLTASTALKYFNTTDVVGEFITIKLGVLNKRLKIEGVLEDIPMNSSIQKNLYISLSTHVKDNPAVEPVLKNWYSSYLTTYFRTKTLVQQNDLQYKLDELSEQYYHNYSDQPYEEFKQEGGVWEFPLKRFDRQYINGTSPFRNGDKANVRILAVVGLVILSLVLLNFLNLWTLKTLKRSKEFGVRKFLGASSRQIFKMFFLESALYFFLSGLFSLAIAEFLLVQFFDSSLSQWTVTLSQFPEFWMVGAVFFVLFILLFSIYPAWSYLKIKVIDSLKGKFTVGTRANVLRNLLMGGQLVITISFMIVLYFMTEQVNLMKNKERGWDPENVLVVRDPFHAIYENHKDFRVLMNAFEQEAGIESVTNVSSNPALGARKSWFRKASSDERLVIDYMSFGGDFFGTFNINIQEGEDLSTDSEVKGMEIVINRIAANRYELTVGDVIKWFGRDKKIVGISDNISVPPFSLSERPMMFTATASPSRTYYLRLANNASDVAIANAETVWKEFMGTTPFGYHYISDDLNISLKSERELSQIISYFSVFAFIISSLGVLAITGFVCELKLKEVGIRKVLGAAYTNIYQVISFGFYKSLLISFAIAVPISMVLANNWLDAYSDRISIDPLSIGFIGLINFVLISAIVIANSIKTMRVNPSKILRDE